MKPAIKAERPHQTEQRKEHERIPPGQPGHYPNDQQRGESAAPTRAHPKNALRPSAFVLRQPDRKGFRQIRKTSRLARAEEESRQQQRDQVPDIARRSSETRPEKDHP